MARIRASGAPVRELSLRLVEGAEVALTLEPRGERGAGVRSKLRTDAPALELQVFEDGADLTLSFVRGDGAPRCTVRLGP